VLSVVVVGNARVFERAAGCVSKKRVKYTSDLFPFGV